MPNPFRREQDAFRMLLAIVAGAALVIAVTLASGEAVYGIVVGVGLLGFGAGKLWADFRHWQAEGRREPTGPPERAPSPPSPSPGSES